MPKDNPKKNFQDVVPRQRTIRNIELPSRRARTGTPASDVVERAPSRGEDKNITRDIFKESKKPPREVEIKKAPVVDEPDTQEEEFPHTPRSYAYTYDDEPRSSKKGLYVAIGIFVLAFAFGVSALFKSATITITPRNQSKPISQNLSAKKDAVGNDLGYQVVTISKSVEQKVTAQGSQKVTQKARGTIVIYNNESSTPQKLIATTRFQSSDGLVFRLVSPVTVPGKQVKSGKTIPGSVEAVVEADSVGEKYNIPLSDFTLPAFANDPKFKTIYGRSKTPMSGGFDGVQKIVSQDEITRADTALTSQLKDVLAQDISSQIPENFVFFPVSISYDLEPVSQKNSSDTEAIVVKKGTARAVIFDKATLSRVLSMKTMPEVQDDVVFVSNLTSLTFAYATSTDIRAGGDLSFVLSGDAQFVWSVDMNKLKTDLLGLSKKQAGTFIAGQKTIQEGWVQTRPFWNTTIPRDPAHVTLVNTLNK